MTMRVNPVTMVSMAGARLSTVKSTRSWTAVAPPRAPSSAPSRESGIEMVCSVHPVRQSKKQLATATRPMHLAFFILGPPRCQWAVSNHRSVIGPATRRATLCAPFSSRRGLCPLASGLRHPCLDVQWAEQGWPPQSEGSETLSILPKGMIALPPVLGRVSDFGPRPWTRLCESGRTPGFPCGPPSAGDRRAQGQAGARPLPS